MLLNRIQQAATTYVDESSITTLNSVATKAVYAMKDETTNAANDLTVGATKNLTIAAQDNVNVILGSQSNMIIKDSASQDAFLLSTTPSQTTLSSGSGRQLELDGGLAIQSTVFSTLSNFQTLKTDSAKGFKIRENVVVGGSEAVTGSMVVGRELACGSNIFAQNLNIFKVRDVNNTPNKAGIAGYAFVVNDKDQLELLKYSKFDTIKVTKRVAVFGQNMSRSNDQSDTSFLEFDESGLSTVQDGAVAQLAVTNGSSSLLANESITSTMIANGSILPQHISDSAVTTAKIADGAVFTTKLANNSIQSTHIADSNITSAKLAAGAILSSHISASNLPSRALMANSIVPSVIANGAISGSKIASGAILASSIADSNITSSKLANNGVVAANITDNSVIASKLGANCVTTSHVASGAITQALIASSGISAASLADSNITASKLITNGIISSHISNSNVTSSKIAQSNILAVHLDDACVTGDKLTTSTVTTDKFAAEVLKAPKKMAIDTAKTATLSTASTDIYLLNSSKNWGAVRIDGSSNEVAQSVTIDVNGNMYITGHYNSTTAPLTTITNADGTASPLTLRTPTGIAAFIVKFDVSGFAQWVAVIDGTNDENTQSSIVTTDSQGNVYYAGTGRSAVSIYHADGTLYRGPITQSNHQYNPQYASGLFLIKYNSSGVVQWLIYSLAYQSQTTPISIQIDSSFNLYLAMNYTLASPLNATWVGISDAVGGGFSLPSIATNSVQGALIKFSSTGAYVWQQALVTAGGDGVVSQTYGLALSPDQQSVYLSGSAYKSIALSNSKSIPAPTGTSNWAAFLIKYNTSGLAQWVSTLDGIRDEDQFTCDTDTIGNIYMVGAYSSPSIDIKNASGVTSTTVLINNGPSVSTVRYVAMVKYSSSGDPLTSAYITTNTAVTINTTTTYGIVKAKIDKRTNELLISTTYSSAGSIYTGTTLDPRFTITAPTPTNMAIFVAKFSSTLSCSWLGYIDSPSPIDDWLQAMDYDTDGCVYVGAWHQSATSTTVRYADNTTLTLPAATGRRGFVIKFAPDGGQLQQSVLSNQAANQTVNIPATTVNGKLLYLIYNGSGAGNTNVNLQNTSGTTVQTIVMNTTNRVVRLLSVNNAWINL